jgi:hypothetical protein
MQDTGRLPYVLVFYSWVIRWRGLVDLERIISLEEQYRFRPARLLHDPILRTVVVQE